MTAEVILLVLTLLFTKHFVLDFVTQTPYQWMNKGTYGHMGGILHSWLHAFGTSLILCPLIGLGFLNVSPMVVLALCIAEFVIHYHTDWAKMNINKKMGWGANTHHQFWVLTGFDQLVHNMTYVGILAVLMYAAA